MNVYMLLDRSGSMGFQHGFWEETLGSINAYVNELKGKVNIFFAVFDSNGYDVLRNVPLKEWTDVSSDEVRPRGGTPLYDSAARLFNRAFEDNAKRAQFVIITDGEENQSRGTTQAQIKQMIGRIEQKEWQLLFLGANFDKVHHVAAGMAVHDAYTMPVSSGRMEGTMRGLATASQAYFNSGEKFGLSQSMKTSAVAGAAAPYDFTTVKAPNTVVVEENTTNPETNFKTTTKKD